MPVRRIIAWITSIIFTLFCVPIILLNVENLAIEKKWDNFLVASWTPLMERLAELATNQSYLLAFGFIAGVVVTLWILEFFPSRKQREAAVNQSERPETWLRLRLDPSGSSNYLIDNLSNIHMWTQTITQLSRTNAAGSQNLITNDTISLTFERDIEYERPIVESFGHQISAYNFQDLGTKGAVFQFLGAIQAPLIEIRFPPIGYYKNKAAIESVGPTHQWPSNTAQEKLP